MPELKVKAKKRRANTRDISDEELEAFAKKMVALSEETGRAEIQNLKEKGIID